MMYSTLCLCCCLLLLKTSWSLTIKELRESIVENFDAIVNSAYECVFEEVDREVHGGDIGFEFNIDKPKEVKNRKKGRKRRRKLSAKRLEDTFKTSSQFSRNITLTAFWFTCATKELLRLEPNITPYLLAQLSQSELSPEETKLFVEAAPKCGFRDINGCTAGKKARYRTASGACNNLDNPSYGMANSPFRRWLTARYDDTVNSPRVTSILGGQLKSARTISRVVHSNSESDQVLETVTHMGMQWGQFLDHDITLTPVTRGYDNSIITCCTDKGEPKQSERDACFNIIIDKEDTVFSGSCTNFVRSSPSPNIKCNLGPREQLNDITAFIDGSNVYGSSHELQQELRTLSGGLLKTSEGPANTAGLSREFLPTNPEDEGCNRPEDDDAIQCFKAGDERNNEQTGLTSMHTVWLRQHNRIAKFFNKKTKWGDERIFQETRKIVGAMLQHITYNEFLPIILGNNMEEYDLTLLRKSKFSTSYSSTVDPSIRNGFATAAYRFGHSMIPNAILRYKPDLSTQFTPLPYSRAFFNPAPMSDVSQGGPDSVIRGLVTAHSQTVDRFMDQTIHERLFAIGSSSPGLDLSALNIQRGRDHGLPSYMEYRSFCGLSTTTTFNGLKDFKASVVARLKKVYNDPRDIDLFTGAVSESPSIPAIVGPTLVCLLGMQFQALKLGDRFWYENSKQSGAHAFKPAQLKEIRKVTLSKVLCDNMQIPNIQKKAFRPTTYKGNAAVPCSSLNSIDLNKWIKRRGRHDEELDDLMNVLLDGDTPGDTHDEPETNAPYESEIDFSDAPISEKFIKMQDQSRENTMKNIIQKLEDYIVNKDK